MIIKMFEEVGAFASNKDIARRLRVERIIPAIENKEIVTIDFDKVEGATQSFVHALISDVMRKFGVEVLNRDRMIFKSCNENVKGIITLVTRYMQAGLEDTEG